MPSDALSADGGGADSPAHAPAAFAEAAHAPAAFAEAAKARGSGHPLASLASPVWVAPVLLVCAAALSWSFADRGRPTPDEGAYLTAASRILDGLIYYRDIDAYPFPGASYLLALAMALFGEHLSVARGLAGAVFCVVVLGTYAAALALLDRPRAALCGFAVLALKFLAFPIFTMYFYADLSLACAMLAIAVFLRHEPGGSPARLLASGLLVGLAIVTKQNLGIYVAVAMAGVLAAPVLVGGRRTPAGDRLGELTALATGAALPMLVMGLYFARHGLLGAMLASGLLRPFSGYLPHSGVSALPPLRWWEFGRFDALESLPYVPLLYTDLARARALPGEGWEPVWSIAVEILSRAIYTSLPLALSAVAWLRWRARTTPAPSEPETRRRRARFFTAAFLGFAVAASAFPRADLAHVLPAFPGILIVLFGIAGDAAGLRGHGPRAPWCAGAIVTLGLAGVASLGASHDALFSERLRLERADVRVRPEDAWVEGVVRHLRDTLSPDEPLFVYGHEAFFYFLADRHSPWPFAQLYPGMEGGDQGAALARRLRQDPPRIVLRGVLYWPGVTALPSYTEALWGWLQRAYRDETSAFFETHPPTGPPPPPGFFELWRRRADAPR